MNASAALGAGLLLIATTVCCADETREVADRPLQSDAAEKLISARCDHSCWASSGVEGVDAATGQRLAWSVDLVRSPPRARDGICRVDVLRIVDQTALCESTHCQESKREEHLRYAARSDGAHGCPKSAYPKRYFLLRSELEGKELAAVVSSADKIAANGQKAGGHACVRSVAKRAEKYEVEFACGPLSGKSMRATFGLRGAEIFDLDVKWLMD